MFDLIIRLPIEMTASAGMLSLLGFLQTIHNVF